MVDPGEGRAPTLFVRKDRHFSEVPELSSQNSTFIVKRAPSLAEGLDPPLDIYIEISEGNCHGSLELKPT